MSMLFPIDPVVVMQIITVFFGTIMAAPLLSSLDARRRRIGFVCMMLGSLAALLATASAGLWILVAANAFWTMSSLRGFWLLHASIQKDMRADVSLPKLDTPKEPLAPLQAVLNAQVHTLSEPEALAEVVTQTIIPQSGDMVH